MIHSGSNFVGSCFWNWEQGESLRRCISFSFAAHVHTHYVRGIDKQSAAVAVHLQAMSIGKSPALISRQMIATLHPISQAASAETCTCRSIILSIPFIARFPSSTAAFESLMTCHRLFPQQIVSISCGFPPITSVGVPPIRTI